MDSNVISALTSYAWYLLPEIILATIACVLFLSATFHIRRSTAAVTALIALGAASLAVYFGTLSTFTWEAVAVLIAAVFLFGVVCRDGKLLWIFTGLFGIGLALLAFSFARAGQNLTVDARLEAIAGLRKSYEELVRSRNFATDRAKQTELRNQVETTVKDIESREAGVRALAYSSPLYQTRFALFVKLIAILGSVLLVLLAWNDVPDSHAGEFHGCLLLIVAGTCVTGGGQRPGHAVPGPGADQHSDLCAALPAAVGQGVAGSGDEVLPAQHLFLGPAAVRLQLPVWPERHDQHPGHRRVARPGPAEPGHAGRAAGGPGAGRGGPGLPHHGGAVPFLCPGRVPGNIDPGGGPAGLRPQGGRVRGPGSPAGLRAVSGTASGQHQRAVAGAVVDHGRGDHDAGQRAGFPANQRQTPAGLFQRGPCRLHADRPGGGAQAGGGQRLACQWAASRPCCST